MEARVASDEAVLLRSWATFYRSYKSYRQCDDAVIGESNSESVARILVDRWGSLPELAHLAGADDEFRSFVIKHVDATLNMDDVEKIKKNTETQCPLAAGAGSNLQRLLERGSGRRRGERSIAASMHHGNVEATMAHMEGNEHKMTIVDPPALAWVEQALISGHVYLLQALDTLNDCLRLGFESRLEAANREFRDVWGK
jgi:hypothetical protein